MKQLPGLLLFDEPRQEIPHRHVQQGVPVAEITQVDPKIHSVRGRDDVAHLQEKVIIDIVTVADCLDAATDTVGRSYSTGKKPDEIFMEIQDGADTREKLIKAMTDVYEGLDAETAGQDLTEFLENIQFAL